MTAGGVWLQKARPGSSSPGTGLYTGNPAVGPNVTAYEPKLSLNMPMGTPLGTYSATSGSSMTSKVVDRQVR